MLSCSPQTALEFYSKLGYTHIAQNDEDSDINYLCSGSPRKNTYGGYDCESFKAINGLNVDWSGFLPDQKIYPKIEELHTVYIGDYECEYNADTEKIFVKKENFWFNLDLLHKYYNIMQQAERKANTNGKDIVISTKIKVGCKEFTFNQIEKLVSDIKYIGY